MPITKRVLMVLIVVVFLLTSVFAYDLEIRYQGVEWGASTNTVSKALSAVGLHSTRSSEASYLYPWAGSSSKKLDGYIVEYQDYWPGASKQYIAGHLLSNWYAYFCEGEKGLMFYKIIFNFRFDSITADSTYIETYNDLKNKLTRIYGEGRVFENSRKLEPDESGYSYNYKTKWEGANNTAIVLEFSRYVNKKPKISVQNIFRLTYGQTDDKVLNDAQKYQDQKKAEESARKKEEISKNTNGL